MHHPSAAKEYWTTVTQLKQESDSGGTNWITFREVQASQIRPFEVEFGDLSQSRPGLTNAEMARRNELKRAVGDLDLTTPGGQVAGTTPESFDAIVDGMELAQDAADELLWFYATAPIELGSALRSMNAAAQVGRVSGVVGDVAVPFFNARAIDRLYDTGEVTTSFMRRIGRLGGEIADARYVEQITESLQSIERTADGERMKISVEFMESRTAKHIARYEAQLVDGVETGVLFIPKDVTKYEILHEIAHIRHHFDQGAGFRRLTEAAREKHVYDQLLGSPYWQFFTAEQKVDAFMQYKNAVNRVRR
jgi:hypothetical protein